MVRRKRVNFKAIKTVKKPVTVKFRRSDGSIVKFKAVKAVKKPVKVSFLAKRKKRR
jgi:hypothetical protein